MLAGQTYCRSSIAHTFMVWGRVCWSHRHSILYGERKDKYMMTRLRLKAEAHAWMEAPRIKTLIPFQRDRWKRKPPKKAANSDIAFWLKRNRTTRQIVQRGGVLNIRMTMMHTEELKQANTSFLEKILHAKRTTIQDGRRGEEMNDPTERNEEPPD